jgi:hypothetical protein
VNIWKLDRAFDTSRGVTMAILYQENFIESVSAKDDLLSAIERQKLRIAAIPYEVGGQDLLWQQMNAMRVDVVYVAPLRGVDVRVIGQVARARQLRTITGVPEYVELGIAVGIGIKHDRPLIIVNLEQARAEGAVFSSQLLALARIVGEVR